MSLGPAPPSPVDSAGRSHDLSLLVAANLIRPSDAGPEGEYRFKHSMVQETAYAMLLRERRAALHRQVARAMEGLSPAAAASQPAVLAYHYFHGGEDGPAFRFGLRAAEAARANYAYAEALANYDLALEAAGRLEYGDVRRDLRAAYLGKGKTLETSGDHDGARAVFRQMLDLGARRGDKVMEAEALNRMATLAVVTADPAVDVEASLARALELARQAGAPLLTARTLWNQGLRERFRDPLRAETFFMQALEITHSPACLDLPQAAGVADIESHVLIDLMVSYMSSGRRREALQRGREALDAFRRLDDKAMVADALAGLGLLHHFGGEFEAALAHAAESGAISGAIDNPWGKVYSGWIELTIEDDRAEWEAALRRGRELIELAAQVPFLAFRATLNGILSNVWLGLGKLEMASAFARQMEAVWNDRPQPGWEAWTRAVTARVHLARGETDAAAARMQASMQLPAGLIPTFQEFYFTGPIVAWLALARNEIAEGLRYTGDLLERLEDETAQRYAGEIRYWRGRLHAAAGDLPAAESDLRRALEMLVPAGARALTWPAQSALADVLARLGRHGESDEQRSQASSVVRSIADDLTDLELRNSFLARAEVAAALASGGG